MPRPPARRQPRRTNARAGWTELPRAGRDAPAPPWPLRFAAPGSADLWAELWATPQAVQWQELGYTRAVARYALVLGAVEVPGASAALLAEVRQFEDRLGLSPTAMARLCWEVAPAQDGPAPAPVAELDEYRDAV